MRILLYIVILALLFLAPVERLDVAKLEPVQTVAVSVADGQINFETDTGNRGRGENVQAAIDDLEENTPGVIYLDTAQYLLITEQAAQYSQELEKYLRTTVKVSLWDGQGRVEQAAKFLAVRGDLLTLRRWNRAGWQTVEKSLKKSKNCLTIKKSFDIILERFRQGVQKAGKKAIKNLLRIEKSS